jgi:dipeptidyl aminopeptidase/acylaminoacyl peptidase
LTLAALAAGCAAAFIASRNYRGAHSLLEADPPSPLLNFPERTGIDGLKSVSFASHDKLKLSAWYKPPTHGAVVIVTHGTNSDRSTMLPELRLLCAAGYGVLAFDWPGLGYSEGVIRWDGQARDALRGAIDWLSALPEVDPRRIGGVGFSIGGFVMAQVAAQDHRLRAVVLEAAPPDFDDYVRLHYTRWGILSEWPARRALRDSGLWGTSTPLNVIDQISPRPVLFLAGSMDGEVSAAMVTKLYNAARDPKTLWVVDGAQHGGYADVAAIEYSHRLVRFFEQGLAGVTPTQTDSASH